MSLDRFRDIVRRHRPAADPVRSADGDGAAGLRELTYEPVDDAGQPLPSANLEDLPGARVATTPHGEVVIVEHRFHVTEAYGRHRIGDMEHADAEALRVLTGRPVSWPASARGTVFLDLETTGLSSGAGTVPFLVGCALFEGEHLVVRQYVLPSFAAERGMLALVAGEFDAASGMVTYNGRGFDVPVMESRWGFHRQPCPLDDVPHVDMLPPARRLWRAAAEASELGCRLVHLEEIVLGVVRSGDVPGWEIPYRYFDFLRSGDASLLEPILLHNRLDLISLAAVTAHAQRLVKEGPDVAAVASECVALGRLYMREGDLVKAEAAFKAACEWGGCERQTREAAYHGLAILCRRERRYAEAAEAWRSLIALGHGRTTRAREAIEALAIHNEHRARDLATARALALRALQEERDPSRRAAVRHRLARIERKMTASRTPAAANPSPLWDGS